MAPAPDVARAALRVRQGPGARHDAPTAPAAELLWARRGTAYFARRLNALGDDALDADAAVPGRSRRQVVAGVGCGARALAHLIAFARTGMEAEGAGEATPLADEVALAATLPATALRHLVAHAALHLDVEWRDLTDEGWAKSGLDRGGHTFALRETPRLWARAVWGAALDLGNGGRVADLPLDLPCGPPPGLADEPAVPTFKT